MEQLEQLSFIAPGQPWLVRTNQSHSLPKSHDCCTRGWSCPSIRLTGSSSPATPRAQQTAVCIKGWRGHLPLPHRASRVHVVVRRRNPHPESQICHGKWEVHSCCQRSTLSWNYGNSRILKGKRQC